MVDAELLRFVLERHWGQLGGALRADFTDQEAVATIVRMTDLRHPRCAAAATPG